MRILLVGAGGVGSAVAAVAARRDFFEHLVVADYDAERAERAAASGGERFSAASIDASDEAAVGSLIDAARCDVVLNATDPRFVMPVFRAALEAGAGYLDMAMSLSTPHPDRPYEQTGVKLGDEQFELEDEWRQRDQLALVGIGVEPGLSDVFARYAADQLFSEVHDVGVRDGSDLVVDGYDFAPTFSIWTTIEECLNPPVVWEAERGWFTTEPFSEPETFDFPEGIGPVECVNVEHEEVLLIPRWIDARRVTFKYGLGDEFIGVLKTLHKLGLDRVDKRRVGDLEVSPRDVVAAGLPDPATLGDRMSGRTCAGTWVTGLGTDGRPRDVYLYHVVDNEWSMREYGAQAVVWQTAVNPVVALELLATGAWEGAGVLGPEALPPGPFLELLGDHGAPWGCRDG
ncbi:MAG: saccharopine dehydrogenase NADP-binding domain-containing protein [Acidimicrobiia bacterium]|jgi:saccharopine dehydrogenase-like NADP-dependent oxidoreductase|nr:saccharopine dehydrogenase NADP-binding domain-containing protein [Acidimicrobiia bacterium]MBA3982289.1 saccharopine dehydrogenase NADP-binding domain-containing protein [Acidimicrobiia bacterium]MDQ3390558.1 saccharopine dehydrogenase NADP-binding domain-containing protein [Actinomycetota bacterium]